MNLSALALLLILGLAPLPGTGPSSTPAAMLGSKHLTQSMTLLGRVKSIDLERKAFEITCRTQDDFLVFVGVNTVFASVENLGSHLPYPDPTRVSEEEKIRRHLEPGRLVVVQGIYQEYKGVSRFDARRVHLAGSSDQPHLFEDAPDWWVRQIAALSNEWLDDLFGDTRGYQVEDFSRSYRTNLDILGGATDDNIQECATLSRLIYGLSSAYLLTGNPRYFEASRAAVAYQRQTFRVVTPDGEHCFWAHASKRLTNGAQLIMPSSHRDDEGTFPLYEQIYALSGLAQYLRITQDWEVLRDIERTLATFQDYYLDREHGGYFSHLHPVSLRPDDPELGPNRSRKNWNSIGDHIPAYLINVILALDPLPTGREDLAPLRESCLGMLETLARLIVDRFPDPDPRVPFFLERFHRDWTPDLEWGWQQDRAIVGHNLKIAWNLMRCRNHFLRQRARARGADAKRLGELADSMLELSREAGRDMALFGVDRLHGGVYDILERRTGNGMFLEFPWSNTKEFWQQEQGILAYLILHGARATSEEGEDLDLAREISMFWNLFFLDRENSGCFFRVTDNGLPVVEGGFGTKGGHAISGYHAFELDYLAHIYNRLYVRSEVPGGNEFTLYFRPAARGPRTLNVLPDFVRPGNLEIVGVRVDGHPRPPPGEEDFQLHLGPSDRERHVEVRFRARFPQRFPVPETEEGDEEGDEDSP